jgi:hypothetical protein
VLRGSYRRAVAELNSVCRAAPQKAYADRVRLLDELITAQQARKWLAEEASFAEWAFGELWAGEASPWSKIEALLTWVDQCDKAITGINPLRAEVLSASVEWEVFAEKFERSLADLGRAVARITSLTGIQWTFLGIPNWEQASIADFAGVIGSWRASLDVYNDWVAARDALGLVRFSGLEVIARGLYDGSLEPSAARPKTDLLIAEALWRRARSDDPVLDEIDGTQRSECVESFRSLDRRRIDASRSEVLGKYLNQRPTGSTERWASFAPRSAKNPAICQYESCWSAHQLPCRRLNRYS